MSFLLEIAVWLSASALVSTDVVTVHRARLALGWVIVLVCRQPSSYIHHPWVDAVSTSESCGVNGHTALCTSPVCLCLAVQAAVWNVDGRIRDL